MMLLENATKKNRYTNDFIRRVRRTVFLVLLAAGLVYLALYLADRETRSEAVQPPHPPKPALVKTLEPGVFQAALDHRSSLVRLDDKIGPGDTLGHVLERLGLTRREAHYAAQAAGEAIDLTKVRPGARVSLFRHKETGEPVRMEYQRTPARPRLILVKTPSGYAANWEKYEPVRLNEAVSGRIKNTLWGSAVQLYGLDPDLVMNLADLFAYDIDFLTDIQEGDEFGLLYETNYTRGRDLGPGRIYGAYFVNQGKRFEAYHFLNSEDEDGYYDAKGNSLKKMFLKSPLQYRRISSHFSRSRLHPILKIRRPHLGVDYSAPQGTPVETVASGKVAFAGWKGGYGKIVIVKHSRTYTTQYAHLSKFPKGLKKADKVKQGDLIGYVGSTGLSTGPHLDFRMTKGGKFVDPLKELKSQTAVPLAAAEKPRYLELVEVRRAEMSRLLGTSQASAE